MPSADLVIADFDGTLVDLPIDWSGLRSRLGVRSIDQLFTEGGEDAWAIVREEETRAARLGPPRRDVISTLESARAVAVLTANSEHAVAAFLEREPGLAAVVVKVVGRETAQGPKRDQSVFNESYRRCVDALAEVAGEVAALTYLGDQDYELAFAAELGAAVRDVRLGEQAKDRNAL